MVRALLACPSNLWWKIWLVGARTEISAGKMERARKLLRQALKSCPAKSRTSVFLECSRAEEHFGNIDCARRILLRTRRDFKGDWKLYLEAALLEARCGNFLGAMDIVRSGLAAHRGTGRLWSVYLQLSHRLEGLYTSPLPSSPPPSSPSSSSSSSSSSLLQGQPELSTREVLLLGLQEVPKSGEVWSEGAKCLLNPLHTRLFDPGEAQRYLSFAIQFTPQYGDTFVEALRVEILCQIFIPRVLALLGLPIAPFLAEFLTSDVETDLAHITTSPSAIYAITALSSPIAGTNNPLYRRWRSAQRDFDQSMDPPDTFHGGAGPIVPPNTAPPNAAMADRLWRRGVIASIDDMHLNVGVSEHDFQRLHLPSLYRRAVNADPNYGVEWFYCSTKAVDSPMCILESARTIMTREMLECQHVYTRAALHYIESCCRRLLGPSTGHTNASEGVAGSSRGSPNNAAVNVRQVVKAAVDRGTPIDFKDLLSECSLVGSPELDAKAQVLLSRALGSADDQRNRIMEFVEDCAHAKQPLAGPDPLSPDADADAEEASCGAQNLSAGAGSAFERRSLRSVEAGGTLFLSSDFLSSLICLNRTQFNRNLKDEGRRYLLYGSDSIL